MKYRYIIYINTIFVLLLMHDTKICIVGLGYVGLPLACLCAKKAFTTFGYDINNNIIEKLKKGETIINEQSLKEKLVLVKDKITVDGTKSYSPVSYRKKGTAWDEPAQYDLIDVPNLFSTLYSIIS